MRFAKLVVESFQAIQRADVEFGPGLNVLYGPNDLGKSTLATAIRAALLVPSTSSEAESYTAWYADATPRVALTFVDDSGHYWRVKKAFGGGAGTGAELEHSKDGTTFTLDCKARQVEDKLRSLLAWGIPAPGGKGAPRGLPDSFLANVLLAAQTDVDAILGRSLATDPEGSGKLRLTKALATLAQDPVLKRVLDAAQKEVDLCFTPTGKRKRGQTSKFTDATKMVKQLQEQLSSLQRQLAESSAIEQHARVLSERRAETRARVDDANAALEVVRQGLQRARIRDEARARLEAARAALGEIERRVAEVEKLKVEVEAAAERAKVQEEVVRTAGVDRDAVEAMLRAAVEAHRLAISEDGVREREVRRAQLAEQASLLRAAKQAAEARRGKAEAALKARTAADTALRAAADARAQHERLGAELVSLLARVAQAKPDLAFAASVVAYGRWRDATSAAEDAKRTMEAAAKNRVQAGQREADATSLYARARTIEEEVATGQAALPTPEQAAALEQLERELTLAEAALGGGISVAVRPRAGISVRGFVDETILNEPNLSAERVLEAERSVRLSIGELVDIEVTAGAAEKRQVVEALRTRWRAEAVPVLERAEANSPQDILNALGALARERAAAAELRRDAERLRAEAKSRRDQAAIQEEHVAKLEPSVADVEARRAAIGDADLGMLEAHLTRLGKAWETQASALYSSRATELKKLQDQAAAHEQRVGMAAYQAAHAEQRAGELDAEAVAALAALESPDPEALLRSIDEELASLSGDETANAEHLSALLAEASTRAEEAARVVDAAKAGVRSAGEAQRRAEEARDRARDDLNALLGKQSALKSQLDAMDRAGAEELVKQRERELAALPDEGPVSAEDVEAAELHVKRAEQELADASEELHKSEGALSKVGGAALAEEVARVEEALRGAQNRERDFEIEADAWKLLFETLREVENEEGAHLGRALAGSVTTTFVELTGGRYKGLRLDATLKTEAIEIATHVARGADVLDALSVGTRNQLATLIRLTIADHLKSSIVLDDHLVHTDPTRLAWFRDILLKTALTNQVIVFTCRPEDYVAQEDLPAGTATRDLAGGAVRVIDGARVMKRWAVVPSLPLYPVEERFVPRPAFTIVANVEEAEQFRDALPVYDLAVAAGAFSTSQAPEAIGWARVKSRHALGSDMFAARIVGKSMEPGVPDGAWVIFRGLTSGAAPPPAAVDGRRVLVQLRDDADPETGGRYTFKRWRITRFSPEGDVEEVELRADNPAYPSRRLTAQHGDLRVVAEFVETIG
jgi:uncharacterized protein YhaN